MIAKHDLIDRQLDAYRRRDVEAFAAFYASNILILRNNVTFVSGHDDLKAKYASLFALSPQLKISISERKIDGPCVSDIEHIWGLRGNQEEVTAHVLYRIENSKIVEVTMRI